MSTVHDALTTLTGKNLVTGESVGAGGRAIAALGLVTPLTGGEIRGAGKLVRHHVFPQRFARQFEGLIDINQHTMMIGEDVHRAIHAGAARGGAWNQAWEQFFKRNSDYDVADLYHQAQKLIREFGITGAMTKY